MASELFSPSRATQQTLNTLMSIFEMQAQNKQRELESKLVDMRLKSGSRKEAEEEREILLREQAMTAVSTIPETDPDAPLKRLKVLRDFYSSRDPKGWADAEKQLRDIAESEAKVETEKARQEQLRRAPTDKSTTTFEAWRQQNPDAPVSEWLKLESSFKPEREQGVGLTREIGTRIKQFNPDTQRYDIDAGPAPPPAPVRPTATERIYADEDIGSWVEAVTTGQAKLTDVPVPIRGKVNAATVKSGNLNIPPKVREQVNGVDRAIGLIKPAEDLVEKIIAGEDRITNSLLLENYTNSVATLLSRSLGERGVATEGDVNRAKGLVAGWKAANFAPSFARRELALLQGVLDSQRKALTTSYFKKLPSTGEEDKTPKAPSETAEKVVVVKDGKRYRLPKSQLERAKKQGYQLAQ